MIATLAFATCLVSASASQAGLGVAGQAREQALETEWSRELNSQPKQVAYQSPIKRVISLLGKMRAELVAEADKEAEMYDKMVCWCETNEKEKKKAIADAEALEKELEAEIQERAAKFGEDATEIDRLKEQIAEDTASSKEATSIREAEAAKFLETNKDLVQSITNVKNAVQILSKHQSSSSFIQLDASVLSSMHTVLKDLAFKLQMQQADKSEGIHFKRGTSFLSLTTESASMGETLLNSLGEVSGAVPLEFAERVLAKTAAKGAQPAFLQGGVAPSGGSYAPQSGQIFGILTTMKEEFEANLSEEEKSELKSQADFEAMSKAKSEQIATAKEKLDALEGANADNQKALSDAKENLELTREQRSNDVEFLRNLKTTCMDLDQQWATRSKTRAMETQAVSEALKIITGDDAMDLLRDSVKFLQVNAESQMRMRRSRAMASLRKAAQSPSFEADDLLAAWHNRGTHGQRVSMLGSAGGPRMQLSTLAVSVGLDSFTKIKEAMDKMVAELKVEQEEEVKFKAYCTKELNLNEKQTYEKTEAKEDLEALIEKLTKLVKKLSEEIAAANAQIAETETAILKASQVREGENAEFQTTVADQRATQDILTKALAKLKAFYKNTKGGALLQKVSQEPPVKFNSYSKNAGASPVIGMIEQIIEDSKALESEAVAGETEAQASYELFVKDSNAVIKGLSESVASKTKASATAKQDTEQAKSDLDSTVGELESLALVAQDLHGECDWVVRNFAARQKARLEEMEAIGQAKGILSGAQ
jgi:hypothetical protein